MHNFYLHQASKECQVLSASLGLVPLFAIWLQLVMLRPLAASLLPLRESVSKLALRSVAWGGGSQVTRLYPGLVSLLGPHSSSGSVILAVRSGWYIRSRETMGVLGVSVTSRMLLIGDSCERG